MEPEDHRSIPCEFCGRRLVRAGGGGQLGRWTCTGCPVVFPDRFFRDRRYENEDDPEPHYAY